MSMTTDATRHFLVASDFDQTLSFNDSGLVLSELIGARISSDKVDGPGREQPGSAGRGARLSHPPRSGVPRRPARAPRGDRPPRAAAQRHSRARRLPDAGSTATVLVLRDLGRARRKSSSRRSTASCRRTTSSAPSSSSTPTRARCGRSGACPRATARSRCSRSSRAGWASRPIARSTSATAAPTCTSCCTSTTATDSPSPSPRTRLLARIAQATRC